MLIVIKSDNPFSALQYEHFTFQKINIRNATKLITAIVTVQ